MYFKKLAQISAFLATASITVGCACPRASNHYEKNPDGTRDPLHQCTLEAIECATKPDDMNLPIATTPIWLLSRGLYRLIVPADKRNRDY